MEKKNKKVDKSGKLLDYIHVEVIVNYQFCLIKYKLNFDDLLCNLSNIRNQETLQADD